ncbi:hypothetical protein L195_g032147 [Trifolium pratense]|uniref:Uncharacterized protein n=1 Tax=Trifolium pratense TaxID=57577 RepID=A0A2K3LCE0_TRIPR|nr:hypothetical protein L195_g032147 [Trifolium pratense]
MFGCSRTAAIPILLAKNRKLNCKLGDGSSPGTTVHANDDTSANASEEDTAQAFENRLVLGKFLGRKVVYKQGDNAVEGSYESCYNPRPRAYYPSPAYRSYVETRP